MTTIPTRRLLVLAALLFTGCAFTSRPLLLKEYEPSLPKKAASPLVGKAVFVRVLDERVPITDKWTGTEPNEPGEGFVYRKMTEAEEDRWDQELDAIKEKTDKKDWQSVGWLRNGVGMHTADVYAVNDPKDWMKQVLELEMAAQGAVVVPAANQADLVVEATLKYLKVDIYMKYWCDLVVAFRLQPTGGASQSFTLHGAGGYSAWSSSSFEYFNTIRATQQELFWVLLPRIEAAVSGAPMP